MLWPTYDVVDVLGYNYHLVNDIVLSVFLERSANKG